MRIMNDTCMNELRLYQKQLRYLYGVLHLSISFIMMTFILLFESREDEAEQTLHVIRYCAKPPVSLDSVSTFEHRYLNFTARPVSCLAFVWSAHLYWCSFLLLLVFAIFAWKDHPSNTL